MGGSNYFGPKEYENTAQYSVLFSKITFVSLYCYQNVKMALIARGLSKRKTGKSANNRRSRFIPIEKTRVTSSGGEKQRVAIASVGQRLPDYGVRK